MLAGCRCPRCSDATLAVATVEGREILECTDCEGTFVGARLGLRLLATLQADVLPTNPAAPSPACPVCRRNMRRVVAGAVESETCKAHGVWIDAGGLAICSIGWPR